jgi:threonine aldolase
MNFASDNTAGIAPRVLDALARANGGYALGYGKDAATHSAERRIAELFECEPAVFFVATGTAANALALAQLSPPWGAVLCHAESHIVTDECGAPEFLGGGLRLLGIPGEGCKVTAEALAANLDGTDWGGPHHLTPAALSLSQATEAGTIYRPSELRALADRAHARGLAVHMDGARLGNALVRLGVTPAEATWKAGVDVLSFGATKGGALAAEAIVFFDPARATGMPERRKRSGHLLSKHRFLAGQFEAFLARDYWLELARHANTMADRLAAGLSGVGVDPVWPVEANLVFVTFDRGVDAKLKAAGAHYYVRRSASLPAGMRPGPDRVLARLVTSFATTEAEIGTFVDTVAGAISG